MPLKASRRMPDMEPDELSDLFLTSQIVQRGMELFHGVSSSNVAVQDGPDAGQSIQVGDDRYLTFPSCSKMNFYSACPRPYPASAPERFQGERPSLRRTEQSRQGTQRGMAPGRRYEERSHRASPVFREIVTISYLSLTSYNGAKF